MENMMDQSNFEEEVYVNKIKTPASLFSKSHSKSPMRQHRSLASPNPTHSFHPCSNHPDKNAPYYSVAEGQQLHFCEKCAITLASQGHNIFKHEAARHEPSPQRAASMQVQMQPQRSSRLRQSNPRQLQIQSFLEHLTEARGRIGSTRQAIKDKLIESQQFYGEQLQQINSYFTLIMKSLQLQKHKCYNHILKQRTQAEAHIRSIDQELTRIDEGVTKIQLDIQDNIETVYSIDEEMYQLVYGQYQQQKEDFDESVNGLLVLPIEMRRIEFEGVPESIYNLSEMVIQNSINSQNPQQYCLAQSLQSEDLGAIDAVSPRDPFRNRQHTSGGTAQSLKFSFEAQRLQESLRQIH